MQDSPVSPFAINNGYQWHDTDGTREFRKYPIVCLSAAAPRAGFPHTTPVLEDGRLITSRLDMSLPTSIYCQLSRLTISTTCRTYEQVTRQQSRMRAAR